MSRRRRRRKKGLARSKRVYPIEHLHTTQAVMVDRVEIREERGW